MKFNETLLYKILGIPLEHWEDECAYRIILKIPFTILFLIVGIPLALIIDFFCAIPHR